MTIRTASRARAALLAAVAFALPLAACSSAPVTTTAASSPSVAVSSQAPSMTPSSAATSAAASATPTASPTPTSTAKMFTMAEVKQHAKASSCWSAIDGKVYDLTKWVGSHPGGRARILSLCGRDGTAAFHGEHGKEAEPNQTLKTYKIGSLA